jgi:hypothetical protein
MQRTSNDGYQCILNKGCTRIPQHFLARQDPASLGRPGRRRATPPARRLRMQRVTEGRLHKRLSLVSKHTPSEMARSVLRSSLPCASPFTAGDSCGRAKQPMARRRLRMATIRSTIVPMSTDRVGLPQLVTP